MNFNTLKEKFEELQELTVRMTACGYDFSKESYFLEKQHLLSLKVSEDNDPIKTSLEDGKVKISEIMKNSLDY